MPLNLIYGPPNSGRAGLVRRRFADALDRDPVLVVPTVDDVYAFERELCEEGAVLGGAVVTFRGLFQAVLTAGGSPPLAELTRAQRLRAISVAVAARRYNLGPLRGSTARPGFALAFGRLLDELQDSGLAPEDMEANAHSPTGSAYLGDLAALFSGYAKLCNGLARVDPHDSAREALALLRQSGGFWRERPVFLYGLDDLTGNQFELVRALAATTEVTVAFPYEAGNLALSARASLLEKLRAIGVDAETRAEADPANTPNPLLFHLERNFGAAEPERREPGEGLVFLRSAGERGEAEAIAAEVAKLLAAGVQPAEIAIALRDPERRGPLIASVFESYGIGTALEAEMPVAATAVGGALIALLEAEFGAGGVGSLLRFLRGPSGQTPQKVDWFEQGIRRRRVQSISGALKLWQERYGRLPDDLARIRRAAARPPAALIAEVGNLARTMASRPLRGREDGPPLEPADALEMRSAGAISAAMDDLSELDQLAPRPQELAATIEAIRFRVWSGPAEGRVRIASPYRLRAARFDHVFVGSLQDGEFPRRDGRDDPFLSDAQRAALRLEARRDTDAEERYVFHACLALPRRRLYLSYRDSDENGVAESPSPLLDDVRRLLDPPPTGERPDPVQRSLTVGRDLAQVVHNVSDAPSENELARAIAAHGPNANARGMLAAVGVGDAPSERVAKRLEAARTVETATRAPGPLSNPAVTGALATVAAYGGTTLEGFDLCSYRWFVAHELVPQLIDPLPDPLIQGGIMHAVLDRLYRERPGGDSLPRPGSLGAWLGAGKRVVKEIAAERRMGRHPTALAIVRRVDGLLARFLTEEAERETGFEPWLLEARFGDEGASSRPALEVESWRLHGAIDRVDRDGDGNTLVIDYKLAAEVTSLKKLEEEAKLQLQLYVTAVAEQWGAQPIGGLYLPLRGTSARRPRGAVLDEVAGSLAPYGLSRTDLIDRDGFEELLADARRRADEIVARMRRGDIRRDPGPRRGLRRHDVCPFFCEFAPICRRDRAPSSEGDESQEEER
jgi:ATP-dependent helicase/DNAse subunit B